MWEWQLMWLRLAGKDLSKGLQSTRTRAVIPEDRRESLPSQLSVPWCVSDHDPKMLQVVVLLL